MLHTSAPVDFAVSLPQRVAVAYSILLIVAFGSSLWQAPLFFVSFYGYNRSVLYRDVSKDAADEIITPWLTALRVFGAIWLAFAAAVLAVWQLGSPKLRSALYRLLAMLGTILMYWHQSSHLPLLRQLQAQGMLTRREVRSMYLLPTLALAAMVMLCLLAHFWVPKRKPRPQVPSAPASDVYEHWFTSCIRSDNGITGYRLIGDFRQGSKQPLVVCLHGFSLFSVVWETLGKRLATSGYRVLAMDLYGRGLSPFPGSSSSAATPSRPVPKVRFTDALVTAQLQELLVQLKLSDASFTVIGHSMGGAVAAAYAARYPRNVHKLVLVSPAGLPVNEPLVAKLARLPVFGDFMIQMLGPHSLTKKLKQGYYKPTPAGVARQTEWINWQLDNTEGYLEAILSTLRHFPLGDLTAAFKAVGQSSTPVFIIWGSKDSICPYSNAAKLQQLIPHSKLLTLRDTGHEVLQEDQELVIKAITEMLRS